MVQLAATVWADGPISSPSQPDKASIRAWGAWIESFLGAIGANSGTVFLTRATLYANLAFPSNTMAWVNQDPVAAYNGIYVKSGASGSGFWTRVGDLPYSFIRANTVGGSPDAVVVSTLVPISDTALVTFSVAATNETTTPTVSFNGGQPLSIVTNTGFPPDIGALRQGMVLAGFPTGQNFQLLTDNVASALLTQIEALRNEASDFNDSAQVHASDATTQAAASAASATSAASSKTGALAAQAQAQVLLNSAQAAYAGFQQGTFYDLGRVADAIQLFPSDLGRVTDH